ncbi:MAG: dTDP-glucose 4,6-dehydratase [Helicobacteraceae bacterium]|jgi:dTDP-glucose 4,6-dehydratase|nr:dTDP-glucose 4,6-dehydratase [Helicobacteraceae bacterium]
MSKRNFNAKTTLLITGGAGFIGSNFIPYFIKRYPNYQIVNLDKLTYAGNIEHLSEVANNPRHIFVRGDICDQSLLSDIFARYDIQGVIHFAAESHVDSSIESPNVFIKTNVLGTFNLIEVAKNYWFNNGGEANRFCHISTDEVYGSLGKGGLFSEKSPYAPTSPYSASKASSDMIVRSYFHTYNLNTVVTNCSNNFGPKQHREKLIPTIIRSALNAQPIPIYGDGKNIRDWLFVTDHCEGIDLAFHKGAAGESYNIGGKNERENLEIARKICEILDIARPKPSGSYKDQITFVKDRLGHDRRYAIDAAKIETRLGWRAKENFENALGKTVNWYLKKYDKGQA